MGSRRANDEKIGLIGIDLGKLETGHGLQLGMMVDATKPQLSGIASITSENTLWPAHLVSFAPRNIPLVFLLTSYDTVNDGRLLGRHKTRRSEG